MNTFYSERNEQSVTSAVSADSAINALVSAAFLRSGGSIVSIKGSKSLEETFSIIDLMVKIEFLANYDLKESTSLINSLIT